MTAPPSPPLVRAAAPAARPRLAATSAARPRLAAALAARPRLAAALARWLAAVALAAPAAGCLVIEPPEYDHPAQTAPVLTAIFPPPHIPIHIDDQDVSKDFSASVLSEDNGDPVLVALYIDYGRRSRGGSPFRRLLSPIPVGAGTIAGGQRSFTIPWDLETVNLPTDGVTPERECHTVTLMASHAFNRCYCPADPEDMSSLTWQIINCDRDDPGCPESCPPLDCNTTPCLFCDDPEFHEGCKDP
ncbi:hypothetical protein [Sorangium sp. So ce1024]|uniref:hypothetical protein n=1 Tax=Sorangium sp. So ce1024 TaxID=3133327 RepID=UPI003F06DBCA